MLTNTQMQIMIDSAAKAYSYGASNPAPAGSTFIKSLDDPNTGAHAQIYRIDGTGEYIVAFTGTQPDDGGQDLYSDFGQNGMDQWLKLQPKLQSFLDGLGSTPTAIHFTGESLGGALAQYATYDMAHDLQSDGTQVTMTTLNALGGQAGIVERDGSVDATKLAGVDAAHLFAVSQGGLPDGVSRLGEGHLGGQTYRVDLNQELGFVERHIALRGIASTFDWSMAVVDTPAYLNISMGTQITEFVANLAYAQSVNDASGYMRAAGGLLTALSLIPKAERDQFIDMLSPNNADAKRFGDYIFDAPATKGLGIVTGIALSLLGVVTENIPQILEKFNAYAYFGWMKPAVSISILFTTAQRFVRPRLNLHDPLTLDLNGNGLETVGINTANPILFDHSGDGVKAATGWVAPNDGLLVWDRNGNGAIDSGRELFGDATLKSNGQLATDGFDALADLDSNHDGKVDSQDTNFADLRVWQDLNQDGITQEGELTTLTAQNITSFNVAKTTNSVALANGNQIADLGSYTRGDGSQATLGEVTGSLGDINLASNPFYSQFTDTIPLTAQAQTLPDMHGSGMVRSLREAASLSPTLATTLTQFSAETYDVQQANLDSLIQQWSETSTFATSVGGAYGARPLTINLEGITTGSAAYTTFLNKLSLLEQFNGQTFRTIPADPTAPVTITILREQQALINQSYQALKQSVYDSLVVQTRLKPYLDAITLGINVSGITMDASGINTALDALKLTDAKGALIDLSRTSRNQTSNTMPHPD